MMDKPNANWPVILFNYYATKAAKQNTNVQNKQSYTIKATNVHPMMPQTRMTLHFYTGSGWRRPNYKLCFVYPVSPTP